MKHDMIKRDIVMEIKLSEQECQDINAALRAHARKLDQLSTDEDAKASDEVKQLRMDRYDRVQQLADEWQDMITEIE